MDTISDKRVELTDRISSVVPLLPVVIQPLALTSLTRLLWAWIKVGGELPSDATLISYCDLSTQFSPKHFPLAWLEVYTQTVLTRRWPVNPLEGYRSFRFQFEAKNRYWFRSALHKQLHNLEQALHLELDSVLPQDFIALYLPIFEESRCLNIAKNLQPAATWWLANGSGGLLLSFRNPPYRMELILQALKFAGHDSPEQEIKISEYYNCLLLSTIISYIVPDNIVLSITPTKR